MLRSRRQLATYLLLVLLLALVGLVAADPSMSELPLPPERQKGDLISRCC